MVSKALKPVVLFLNIPTSLCIKMLKEKHFFRACQLWMYLKSRCRGQLIITPELRRQIAQDLGVNDRTIRNQLSKLYARNWLGLNTASGITFVRGFNSVMKIEGLNGRSAAWVAVNSEINDFKKFKGIIISVSLGYFANKQKWKEVHRQLGSEQLMGSSNHNSKKRSTPSHFPISCRAMIKLFGISNGTASNYKKLALKSGGIDVQKNLKKIIVGEDNVNCIEGIKRGEGIPAKFSSIYKKALPEMAHKIRIRNGYLYLEDSDLIQPLLEYKRRRLSY